MTPRHLLEEFEAFWAAYPKRTGNPKDAARKQWLRLAHARQLPPLNDMIAAAKAYASHLKREQVKPEFIAHTRTWLFQKRFEDWLTAEQKGLDAPPPPDIPKALQRAVDHTPGLWTFWLSKCEVSVTDDTITIRPKARFDADYIARNFVSLIEGTSRRKVEVVLPQ